MAAKNNGRLDSREPLDSLTVQLDSSVSHTFWAFKQDTLGPGLSRVAVADTVTLRLELTQVLPPEPPPSGSVSVLALPDSTPVTVAAVYRLAEYDSLTAARQRWKWRLWERRPSKARPGTGWKQQ